MNTKWLADICNKYDIRSICQTPHSIVVDSRHYVYATNGAVFCAVETRRITVSMLKSHSTVEELLRFDGAYHQTTLAALRDWAGQKPACKICHSYGFIKCPCGGENKNCAEHDEDGDIECPGCQRQSDPYYDPRPGLINGVLINLKQVALPLHHLDGDLVRVITQDDESPVHFITPEWRVVIMPTRKTPYLVNSAVAFNQWQEVA